jgi:hypothetical protein
MKRNTLNSVLFFGIALMVVFIYSCNNTENNNSKKTEVKVKIETSTYDISGSYKMPENTCGFELIITKEREEFNYNIKGKNGIVDIFGKISVNNENGASYVNLTLPESFSAKTVEGLLENNKITIQNYGNAGNQFTIFEDCEDKYMEFIKE